MKTRKEIYSEEYDAAALLTVAQLKALLAPWQRNQRKAMLIRQVALMNTNKRSFAVAAGSAYAAEAAANK